MSVREERNARVRAIRDSRADAIRYIASKAHADAILARQTLREVAKHGGDGTRVAAATQLARIAGLLRERVELTGPDGKELNALGGVSTEALRERLAALGVRCPSSPKH